MDLKNHQIFNEMLKNKYKSDILIKNKKGGGFRPPINK